MCKVNGGYGKMSWVCSGWCKIEYYDKNNERTLYEFDLKKGTDINDYLDYKIKLRWYITLTNELGITIQKDY